MLPCHYLSYRILFPTLAEYLCVLILVSFVDLTCADPVPEVFVEYDLESEF